MYQGLAIYIESSEEIIGSEFLHKNIIAKWNKFSQDLLATRENFNKD